MITINNEDTSYLYAKPLYDLFQEQKDDILYEIRRTSFKRAERIGNSIGPTDLNLDTSKDEHFLYFSFYESKFIYSTYTPIKPYNKEYILIGSFGIGVTEAEIVDRLLEISDDYFQEFMNINLRDTFFEKLDQKIFSVYLMSLDDLGFLISKNTMKNYAFSYQYNYNQISRVLYKYAAFGYGGSEKFTSDYDFIKDYHRLSLLTYASTGSKQFVPTGLNYAVGIPESKINKAVLELVKNSELMYSLNDDESEIAKELKSIYKKEFGLLRSAITPLKLV